MKSKNMKVLSAALLVAGLFTSVSFGAAQSGKAKGHAEYRRFDKQMKEQAEVTAISLSILNPNDPRDRAEIEQELHGAGAAYATAAHEAHRNFKGDPAAEMAFFKHVLQKTCGLGSEEKQILWVVPPKGNKPSQEILFSTQQSADAHPIVVYLKPPVCTLMTERLMRETPIGLTCWLKTLKVCSPMSPDPRAQHPSCEMTVFAECAQKLAGEWLKQQTARK